MTSRCYYLTMLLLDDAMTLRCYYFTCHEKWLDMTWWCYYLTMLLLHDAITWQCYYFTMLWLYDAITLHCYYLTMLLLNDAITWRCYYWTMLLLYDAITWRCYHFTMITLGCYDFAMLLLDDAITLRCYGFTMLWLYDAITLRCCCFLRCFFAWQCYYFTMLLLDVAITLRCYYFTMLLLYDAITWRCYYFTMLLLDDAITWRCDLVRISEVSQLNFLWLYIYILIYSMVLYGFLMLCSTTKFANPVLGANAYNHHILWPIRSWVSHPQWYCILDAVCCSLWVGPRPRLVPEYHTEVATTEEANMEAATKVGQHTEVPELVMDPSRMPNIALQLDEFGYFDVIAEMASSKWNAEPWKMKNPYA